MASTHLRNGYVVTVDAERRVFTSGFIRVEGDRIAAIGPMAELADRRRRRGDRPARDARAARADQPATTTTGPACSRTPARGCSSSRGSTR